MKLQVLKVGTHTDSKGNVHEFKEETLKNIASLYDPKTHEAPMVLGHPKDNDPAVGWIKSASYNEESKSLELETDKEHPEFMEAFKQGSFKKWSVSLYPDKSLRHLGFLGAVPPAIKGLSFIGFSQEAPEDGLTFDFMDYDEAFLFNDIGRILRNMRDYFIEKEGLEKANAVIPTYYITDLEKAKATPNEEVKAVAVSSYSEHPTTTSKEGEPMTPQEQAEFDRLKAENASFSEENKTLKTQAKTKEYSDFCEELVKSGKMKAEDKPKNIQILTALGNSSVNVEFSEGQKSAVDAFKETLSSATPLVDFSETATKSNSKQDVKDVASTKFNGVNLDEDRTILFNEAMSLKDSKGISFEEALTQVQQSKAEGK